MIFGNRYDFIRGTDDRNYNVSTLNTIRINPGSFYEVLGQLEKPITADRIGYGIRITFVLNIQRKLHDH